MKVFPLILLALFLAACNAPQRSEAPIRAYGLEVQPSELSRELNVFIYSDYIEPSLVDSFEAIYGVNVIMDYYDSSEALLAKLKAGAAGQYDLIVPADYVVTILRKLDLVEKLDTARIPNLKNLDPRFRKTPYDPTGEYSACYQWGTTGLGVRTDLVKQLPADSLRSWRVLFEPTCYPGKFTLLDDPREVFAAALKYLGYSVNTIDTAEIRKAEELILSIRPRVTAYNTATTGRDFLAGGDVPVIHNHSGDVYYLQDENVSYFIPKEGAVVWSDNMAIPKGAAHKRTAEVFMNFILDAQNGAKLTNYTYYASPNAASMPLIEDTIRNNPSIFPDPEAFARLEYIQDVGEATRIFSDAWTRIKAAKR